MKFKVVFSENGFDHTAHFDNTYSFSAFANLMAQQGRLTKAVVEGFDVTANFVTIVKIN